MTRHLFRAFTGPFLASIGFFSLLFLLLDLFVNIWAYMNNDVPIDKIAFSLLLYLPKCVSFSLPVAMLFGSSFALGTLYSQNELIVVFGAGRSLTRFVLPLLLVGLLASGLAIAFDDLVVLPSYQAKKSYVKEILKQADPLSMGRNTVRSQGGRVVYHTERFDADTKTIFMPSVVRRDEAGRIAERLDATSARWNGESWLFLQVRRFRWVDDRGTMTEERLAEYSDPEYSEEPASFERKAVDVAEYSLAHLETEIDRRIVAGQPTVELETELWSRWFFGLAPFVVMLLSTSIGGRFKKNVLLLCLLLSLIVAGAFYILKMACVVLANQLFIDPFVAGMIPVATFMVLSGFLFSIART